LRETAPFRGLCKQQLNGSLRMWIRRHSKEKPCAEKEMRLTDGGFCAIIYKNGEKETVEMPIKEESFRIGCGRYRQRAGVLAEAGVTDPAAVNRLLNKEVLAAQKAGLSVLYCIGESEAEQPRKEEVLGQQLSVGLEGADMSRVVVAYEPIWSIGPGKTPAGKEYITETARFIKKTANNVDVVYGGGLKADNAAMLASIEEIDGGLIALTRFSGDIGFYPEEYLEIIRLYLGA